MIPVVIATASKIGTLWKKADLETKKKIQKLVFPEGIFGDKKIRDYRTKKRNAVFELLGRISATYGNEKGPPLSEAVPPVRVKGLEPIRRKAPDPKSGLSTNFNTPANRLQI